MKMESSGRPHDGSKSSTPVRRHVDCRYLPMEGRFEVLRPLILEAYGDKARQPFRRDVENVIRLHEK